MNIGSASNELIKALERYLYFVNGNPGLVATCEPTDKHARYHYFDLGSRRFILLSCRDLSSVRQLFRVNTHPLFDNDDAYEIVIVAEGCVGDVSPLTVSRGIKAVSLHEGIADLIGLPQNWLAAQGALLGEVLRPVVLDNKLRAATLTATVDGIATAAQPWLSCELSWSASNGSAFIYVRAEAGKGKSTVLAEVAHARRGDQAEPPIFFLPLRQMLRARGVSWESLAAVIGAVGATHRHLAFACKAGLAALALDGLDEVAGRYDPIIVSDVLRVIDEELRSEHSFIVISGRTTESTLVGPEQAKVVPLDLPETDSEDFGLYTQGVVDAITPKWLEVSAQLPEPSFRHVGESGPPPTEGDKGAITEWIRLIFRDFAKDRSLFFIQSLACLGRDRQLHGNKPLTIKGDIASKPTLQDVCVLAASLACVREQTKIEDQAQLLFSAQKQLELLTDYAVYTSLESTTQAGIPSPNALAQQAFSIDPVNQSEEFTAILRQLQKHALLFSPLSGLSAGDWKPAFLSDWIRSALIARAWLRRDEVSGPRVIHLPNTQRARVAFNVLLPEILDREGEDAAQSILQLTSALLKASSQGSPEACANYWFFYAGLSDKLRTLANGRPTNVTEMTDLSGVEFTAIEFGKEFSGNLAALVGCSFSDCRLEGAHFTSCDLSFVVFEDCVLSCVSFENCDGPITFVGCRFERCTFMDSRSRTLPSLSFVDCSFGEGCSIRQDAPPAGNSAFGLAASFDGCSTEQPSGRLLAGDWLGVKAAGSKIPGLELEQRALLTGEQKGARTLLRALRPFFPSHVGEGLAPQARPYIRLSALGRGSLPEGAPGQAALQRLLEAEGFTTGGRADHLYAPWSSVAGGGEKAFRLRKELLAFVTNHHKGPTIERMIKRIVRDAGW
jgi:hypothetical protein